jgi:gentisate 1,2-dioxygenase
MAAPSATGAVYVGVKGRGTTIVDGKRYDWGPGDFLVVKPWAWHEHLNASSSEDAMLFQVNDTPTLDALGYYREEALATPDGHQPRENHP